MSFLKAEWRKLILVNYAVDPQILKPYLPAKTELDLHNGKCMVSLVGFKFVNTKMLGIKIPFHINFEEVNLRFYVKHKTGGDWKRGVVFIKEIVPKRAISIVANTIYKEHYETCKMRHTWEETPDEFTINYSWKKKGKWQDVEVKAAKTPFKIDPKAVYEVGSLESDIAFITEHYWGYTKIDANKSFEYEVTHPIWDAYPVKSYRVNVDFRMVYGNDFAHLIDAVPLSVMLAEGSEITVEKAVKV
ncbi:MAG: hypothetical protein ACI8ZM_000364 [Crocinitomix sp.]|jgi:uncharacterized protein YqjF (DUF2071 family)